MYFEIIAVVIRKKSCIGYMITDEYVVNFIDKMLALKLLKYNMIKNASVNKDKIEVYGMVRQISLNEAQNLIANNLGKFKYANIHFGIRYYEHIGKILIRALNIEPTIEYTRGKMKGFIIYDNLYMTEQGIFCIDENNNIESLNYIMNNYKEDKLENILVILNKYKSKLIDEPLKLAEKHNKFRKDYRDLSYRDYNVGIVKEALNINNINTVNSKHNSITKNIHMVSKYINNNSKRIVTKLNSITKKIKK